MKIGVCGTGTKMGAAIAQRLTVGHEVGVWKMVDPAKTKPLVDAGAKPFVSGGALAEGCEVVIAMLLNDAATEAVYRGPNLFSAAENSPASRHRHEHRAPRTR